MPAKFKPDYQIYKRYYTSVRHLYQRREVVVYTSLTLSFLAITIFGLFAIKPTITTIAGLIKEIKVKQELDQKLEKRLETLRLAQENYNLAAEAKPIIDEALPEKPYLSQLVYQIEGLTQQFGLTISSLGFGEVTLVGEKTNTAKKIAGPEEISFSARLSGDYENLSDFLNATEELRRLIKIDSFEFVKKEDEEKSSIELNIAGLAYFL